jgi:UDP-3-O-[3-hydroxymyristoyl] glucosamine N-acyltransferase
MMKSFKFIDIRKILDNYHYKVKGDINEIEFDSILSINYKAKTGLDWCSIIESEKVQDYIDKSLSKIIIVDNRCYDLVKSEDKIILFVNNPKSCISEIGNDLFFKKDFIPDINSKECVHPGAILGENVIIGKNCIIGESKIGDNSILYGNNFIYNNVEIGQNVIIYPGAIIGGPGFGFTENKFNNLKRFSHIGKVKIGNNVEIGPNSVIDRGGFEDTVIGDDTKIDSMVHIGHNVKIGMRGFICANATISGSVTIGENVWIAPNCVIKNNIKIADNSYLGIGSVVVNSILKPKKVFGNPAKELRF